MKRMASAVVIGLILIAVTLGVGCESVWVVPPANGRVVDARSRKPIVNAIVTRLRADAPKETKTDVDGNFKFQGKNKWEVAMGDHISAPIPYRVEAEGYQTIETNGFAGPIVNQHSLRHNLGEIQLVPK